MKALFRALLAGAALAAACASPGSEHVDVHGNGRPPDPPRVWTLERTPADEAVAAELEPVLAGAVADVERFFGGSFSKFRMRIDPDRAAFDASFPPEWGLSRTECWMVASGVADHLELLSPRVWRTEACEHDPADSKHVRDLLAHELVHVYHGQHNPSPDFSDVTGIDWFVEGLAVLASGQLESGELASAREALEKGQGPRVLADAWKGKYRYGISGSLVAFVEHEVGRKELVDMLNVTKLDLLLAHVGKSEEELLDAWRAWVLGSP